MSSTRPKLTKADLAAIRERSDSPDVRALLWEIRRLRGIALRADQLLKALGPMGGAQSMMADGLRDELADEPCIEEFPRLLSDPSPV